MSGVAADSEVAPGVGERLWRVGQQHADAGRRQEIRPVGDIVAGHARGDAFDEDRIVAERLGVVLAEASTGPKR